MRFHPGVDRPRRTTVYLNLFMAVGAGVAACLVLAMGLFSIWLSFEGDDTGDEEDRSGMADARILLRAFGPGLVFAAIAIWSLMAATRTQGLAPNWKAWAVGAAVVQILL